MPKDSENEGIDIAGFGKVAKAIPAKVYERSAATLLTVFEQLTAPLTETTSGLGRYLRQKFDNMVEAEKAIATYTVEKAVARAQSKVNKTGHSLHGPRHPKSFVKAIEEASKETDPLLHEMWANLLVSQLTDDKCHPHFIEILPHFSPAEARLLTSLIPESELGETKGGYFMYRYDNFAYWVRKSGDEAKPWTFSCELLCEFHFADVLAPKGDYPKETTILYRTVLGTEFLRAVTQQDQ